MAVTTGTAERLETLKQEAKDRQYADAMKTAGFTDSSDYDAWLVLEEVRKLTKAAAKAKAEAEYAAANPSKPASGGIISGSLMPTYTYTFNNATLG